MEQIKLSKDQENFILSNFGILLVREMSEILEVKERTITYFCSKSNLKLSSEQKSTLFKRRKRKYYMNEKFFNIISNISAYWAGFIAADGCIIDNRLKIKLKSTDEEHLSKFLIDIESNYNILHEVGNRNNTITYSSTILLTSENYVKDLSEIYNITPKKSLTLIPPNITDDNYVDCFIKGIFDGDGTIYIKDNSFCIRFYGTLEINN